MSTSKSKTLSPKAARIVLGVLGVTLTAAAGYLGYHKHRDLAARAGAKGVVEELVERKDSSGKPTYAPKFAFKDAKGAEFHVTSSSSSAAPGYRKGQSVDVLYQPGAPEKATIDTFWEKWAGIAITGAMGLVFLVLTPLAGRKSAPLTGVGAVALVPLEQRLDFHPLNAETLDRYLAGGPDGGLPVGCGITAGASVIPQGRYPVPLCEFCSYMAALVYAEPEVIEKHLRENCPGITNVRFLSNQNTEGLAFRFEGAGFIVLRGTEQKRADWLRNFRALRTGPREFIPPGVSWTAAPRHSGFAEGWDVIREQVEAWIRDARRDTNADVPFIFTGHSLGGALSFLGAYEFAKLGRDVKAVVTFGAALPGGPAFAREYQSLGLDVKTLRLEFDKDAVPVAQFPLLYLPVGFAWQLEKPPLTARERTVGERFRSGVVSVLQSGLSATGPADNRLHLFKSPLMALATVLIYGVPAALTAVKAHNMQQRYALALTTLSYRRLRELCLKENSESEYHACYDRLCTHLQRLRGATPEEPKVFEFMKDLPLRLANKADLDALSAKYPEMLI